MQLQILKKVPEKRYYSFIDKLKINQKNKKITTNKKIRQTEASKFVNEVSLSARKDNVVESSMQYSRTDLSVYTNSRAGELIYGIK